MKKMPRWQRPAAETGMAMRRARAAGVLYYDASRIMPISRNETQCLVWVFYESQFAHK